MARHGNYRFHKLFHAVTSHYTPVVNGPRSRRKSEKKAILESVLDIIYGSKLYKDTTSNSKDEFVFIMDDKYVVIPRVTISKDDYKYPEEEYVEPDLSKIKNKKTYYREVIKNYVYKTGCYASSGNCLTSYSSFGVAVIRFVVKEIEDIY